MFPSFILRFFARLAGSTWWLFQPFPGHLEALLEQSSADCWALSPLKVRVHTAPDRQVDPRMCLGRWSSRIILSFTGYYHLLHLKNVADRHMTAATEACHHPSTWRQQARGVKPQLTPPWVENLISTTNITSVHDGLSQSTKRQLSGDPRLIWKSPFAHFKVMLFHWKVEILMQMEVKKRQY